MNLASRGIDYSGNTYFCRGGDHTMKNSAGLISVFMILFMLTKGMRDMVIGIILSTISNPRWVVLEAELILKDQEDTDVLVEAFSPGTTKSEAGTVLGESGNWTMEISLSGDSNVRLRIAGAIEYSYAV